MTPAEKIRVKGDAAKAKYAAYPAAQRYRDMIMRKECNCCGKVNEHISDDAKMTTHELGTVRIWFNCDCGSTLVCTVKQGA